MEDLEITNEMELNESLLDKDFDDVGWDPIEVDDSDDESANIYGY